MMLSRSLRVLERQATPLAWLSGHATKIHCTPVIYASPSEKTSKILLEDFSPTDVGTVFTLPNIDGEFESTLRPHRGTASRVFNLPSQYVHPKVFNYQLPNEGVPEFAFVGRSNVGKSSLISALLSNKNLVKISKTPGCTQSVNYFAFAKGITHSNEKKQETANVKRAALYLVDLPGYGFAKTDKGNMKAWKKLIKGYLESRDMATLRRVFLLVDARRGLKSTDIATMGLLNSLHLPYQIVITKCDSASQYELMSALSMCFNQIKAHKGESTCVPYVFVTSSKQSIGLEALQENVAEMLSHSWVARKRPGKNAESESILQGKLVGRGPDQGFDVDALNALTQADRDAAALRGGFSSMSEFDEKHEAEEKDLSSSSAPPLRGSAPDGTQMSVRQFSDLLLARGIHPDQVDQMVRNYEKQIH